MTAAEYQAQYGKGKKARKRQPKSAAAKLIEQALQQHRIDTLQRHTGQQVVAEYRFHPERKWRFDFYFPAVKLAVECEGGVYTQGRHTRGKGFLADAEKYNSAQAMGIQVLRFTPDQLLAEETYRIIIKAIESCQSKN